MSPNPTEFSPHTRLIFGTGSIRRVGELACDLNVKHVLLVTDQGVEAAGHAGRTEALLKIAGRHVTVFNRVKENPTTQCVDDCVAVARAAGVDGLVGLGGGSSMDTAKGCNFILTNGGRMQDYWGVGKATKPMLPFIAIPTTSGTGSEMQSAALIADEVTHQKMACLDPKAAARIALLDPVLTLSQPPRVTACTGIDAIAHAVETAVTTRRTAVSQKLSTEAFKLCLAAFPEVLRNPNDLNARGRMQLGAAYAGAAIENSMLGAAHAAANPLTAHFGIVHGQAVGLMLPHVVRFNAGEASAQMAYAALARAAGIVSAGESDAGTVIALCERVESLLALARLPRTLAECGVAESALATLAEEAARQWTAGFNPRRVTKDDFAKLYAAALS